jgi:altronate dehydratase
MHDFIDIDAGRVTQGTDLSAVADELFGLVLDVCNGSPTAAEDNGCREFAINRIGPSF